MKEKAAAKEKKQAAMKRDTKNSDKGLENELKTLRDSLHQARQGMLDEEKDPAKMGALVARLSDSIGRALLNQQKLNGAGDKSAYLRAEVDRILREVGLDAEES